jgi:endonuclease I
MKHSLLIISLWLGIGFSNAQPLSGYYDVVDGKKGAAVKTALMNAIDDHTQRTYKDLWTDFRTTDFRPDGKVWDMYSSITNYVFGDDQNTGGGGREGADYNREHSMPKSWFHDGYPMYTDLFHMYPTDSYINNMRGNYPFGEVGTLTKQSSGGFSKLGKSAVSGYSGTVFEPADEYKGDFARTYFYMATRYESQVAGWSSDMLSGDAYPAFTGWALEMLLKWHRQDPVSEKEIDRNNAVYDIQHNRNPYIDYPVLAEFVWGELKSVAVDVAKLQLYSHEYDVTLVKPSQPDKLVVEDVYDVTGRRVAIPSRGMYIVNYRYSDGTVISRKIIAN